MPKIKTILTLSNVQTLEDLIRYSSQNFDQVVSAINGNLTMVDNIDVKIILCKFTSANVQQSFQHGLGRIPTGYIPIGKTVSVDVYSGKNLNTSELIYLQATAITSVSMLVF